MGISATASGGGLVDLSALTQNFYERTMLDNLKQKLVMANFTKKFSIPKGFGPVIQFRRYTPFVGGTTALSEGVAPTEVDLSVESLNATILQYGNFVKSSDFILSTAINGYNQFVEQAITELSYMAGDSIDLLTRNAFGIDSDGSGQGSTNFTNANDATWAAMTTSDVLTAADLRKVVRKLKNRKVPNYDGQSFVGVIGPDQAYDLQSEAGNGSWLDITKYTTSEKAERGELGKMYSVRLVESTNLSTSAQSGKNISECYVFGKDAVGMVDLTELDRTSGGDRVEMRHVNIYIKEPGSAGTADPLNQLGTVGYKFGLVMRRLQDARVEVLRAGSTN